MKYVDERDAAAILGLSHRTLSQWRWLGVGPPYTKLNGRAVRYRVGDLLAYIEQNRVDPEAVPRRGGRR